MDSARQSWELRDEEARERPEGKEPDRVPVTSGPIAESERGAKAPTPTTDRFKGLLAIGLAFAAVIAVVAAVAAGGSYAIPVLVLALILLGFVGFHRMMGRAKSVRHGNRVGDQVASDSEDPVPHFGFEEDTELGADSDVGTEDARDHSEMKPGAGA
jgi:hypothetical protein